MTQTKTVESWLVRFADKTVPTYRFHFDRFMGWLSESGGELAGMDPDELVAYQKAAVNDERYVILDLVQTFCRTIPGRFNYKTKPYMVMRSFFKHNRAELPREVFTPRAEIPPVVGDLSPDEVKRVVLSSNPCYQAVFLCAFQGGMDAAGIVDWSNAGLRDLVETLPELRGLRRDDRILRVDLPGRKKHRNVKPFYTRIGSDAVDALENWLKRRPEGAKAIFTNQLGDPVNEANLGTYWRRKLKRLGIIEPGPPGQRGNRYGKNFHEIRDVFRSQWEKTPAKGSVAEFMMGHQIDPLEYNKAFRDESWTLGEYRRALPMLQIISSGVPFGQVPEDSLMRELAERDREIEALREEVDEERRRGRRELDDYKEKLMREVGDEVRRELKRIKELP